MYHPFQQKIVSYTRLAPYRSIFRQGIPVLTYHKIGKPRRGLQMKSLYVPPHLFGKQLKEFRQAGFCTTTLEKWKSFTRPNPGKFVITFDDGSRTVFRSACDPLHQFGFSAIQYLVADLIGGKNEWDTRNGELTDSLMDKTEVRAWLSAGHEIGSHTLTHPHLARVDKKVAREEILSSKKKLEDMFGVPIRHFCYPYGSWRRWVRDLVEEAGYETAVTTDPGICTNVPDPFILPRIDVRRPPRTFATLLSYFLPWRL